MRVRGKKHLWGAVLTHHGDAHVLHAGSSIDVSWDEVATQETAAAPYQTSAWVCVQGHTDVRLGAATVSVWPLHPTGHQWECLH